LVTTSHGRATAILPDLAVRVPQPTNGGRTYTFTLKRGIRFAPPLDREVTSHDIKYAFERLARSRNGNWYSFYYAPIRGFTAYENERAPSIAGIATPNASTIRFELARATGDFPYRLTLAATAPVPREVAKCFEGLFGQYGANAVSTGPYMLAGSDAVDARSCETIAPVRGLTESEVSLVRNPNYDPRTDTAAARES